MTGNKAFSETSLIQDVVQRLRTRLPPTWTLEVAGSPAGRDCPDAWLKLSGPSGESSRIAAEVTATHPVRLPSLLDRLRRLRESAPSTALLAIAPYFSPSVRTVLAQAGIGYGDAAGNLRLAIEVPALFVEAAGPDRDPWRGGLPLRSLRSGAAGRAVRAFCDFSPPYGIRELATRARVSLPTLSRVANLLEREGILRTARHRGPIASVDWQAAIRRWAEDYAFTRSNATSAWLEPRGLPALLDNLRGAGLDYALTGSLASTLVAPITAPRLAAIYVDSSDKVSEKLKLRRAETGGNVLLAEPFDPIVFARGFQQDGIHYTARSQTAVDLLTGPGRWPAEGEALLEWMQANESSWRA